MRLALAAALAASAFFVAGCGGGGDDDGGAAAAVPAGAEIVPAEATLFAALDTDFDGEQWRTAGRLLDQFPGGDELMAELKREIAEEDVDFERDIKPAFGPETGFAMLGDLTADEPDAAVFITRPPDPAKLRALLEKGEDDFVTREIEGWTVVAETKRELDEFERRRGTESLTEQEEFSEAMRAFDADSSIRLYVRGGAIQGAFEDGLREEGAPPGLSQRFGRIEALAAGAGAEDDGIRLEGTVATSGSAEGDAYSAELPDDLPAGALLYFSFGDLEGTFKRSLDSIGDTIPDFDRQRAQFEQALGFSLEEDLFPLFGNEGAVAVYPGERGGVPTVTFALAADDEEKARNVVDRFGALASLGGEATTRSFSVGDVEGKEVVFPDEGFSVFAAASDGKLVAASSKDAVADVFGGGQKLAGDPAFEDAREAAEMPDETLGFVYANLDDSLPLLFDFAEQEGDPVPSEARENIEPLSSVLMYSTVDDDRVRFSGFLAIE